MNKSDKQDDFLSVAEAAEYLGVSPATLRRWDKSGKLPAVRRPGSNYRYYRIDDLEPFRLEYRRAGLRSSRVAGFFFGASPDIERNARLREPQREAYTATMSHFKDSSEPAIVQLPVGCGKTGLAALLPFGLAQQRVLVVAPNTTIREGLYADLNITNASCFWKKTAVLNEYSTGPFTALVDGPKANLDDCAQSHIVVANIQQLASRADRWLSQFPNDFFDLVIIDEGHHVAADSWQKVLRAFPDAHIVSLTATPFRADNKDLVGELVYRYPFRRAMINGYIKHIWSASAQPSEVTFTARGENRTYSLDEILGLKEEAWFRRGIALSEECNRHIAEKSLEKLQQLRAQSGFPHQVIASAMSVDHARQVRAIYEELGMQVAEIHSDLDDDTKQEVFSKLRSRQLDCIVQVAMLGEGFDHPPLSVAAIFRPYRSLSPYIQFVGRIMRTVEPNDPNHPDNQGFIVSHVGLNNEERWDDFRELDAEDQDLVRGWARGPGGDGGTALDTDTEPHARRFDDQLIAEDEVVSHFLSKSYLDPNDPDVLDEILDTKAPGGFTLRELGVTAEQLREKYAEREEREEAPAESVAVQPQRRRQTMRKRLDQRSKSVHHRILADLGLPRAGHQISQHIADVRGNNATALFALLGAEINSWVGEEAGTRKDWTLEQVQNAYKALDEIGDSVRTRIETALAGDTNGES